MKKNKENRLAFKKSSLIELNSFQMIKIAGGDNGNSNNEGIFTGRECISVKTVVK